MTERILQELDLLRRSYGEIEHGPNLDWVIIKNFKMPDGWNRSSTELLILITPAYPQTPPDNFYVPPGLKTVNEITPGSYSEPVPKIERQWGQFSYHLDGEWRPTTDIYKGDNLQTFVLKVIDRLKEVN
jgi:hypothetical protein